MAPGYFARTGVTAVRYLESLVTSAAARSQFPFAFMPITGHFSSMIDNGSENPA